MSNFGAFNPIGNTTGFSVVAGAHAAVQVTGGASANPNPNLNTYWVVNTGSVAVFGAMGTNSSVAAAIPADGAEGNGFCVPPGWGMIVTGPPNAFFSFIGAAAGPSNVYVTPGEGGAH